jgi:pilin isopeptide linkage protein/LPXTG-motif cell wall-anchored protein
VDYDYYNGTANQGVARSENKAWLNYEWLEYGGSGTVGVADGGYGAQGVPGVIKEAIITVTVISKSVTYSHQTRAFTWTVTVNPNNIDLAAGTVTDDFMNGYNQGQYLAQALVAGSLRLAYKRGANGSITEYRTFDVHGNITDPGMAWNMTAVTDPSITIEVEPDVHQPRINSFSFDIEDIGTNTWVFTFQTKPDISKSAGDSYAFFGNHAHFDGTLKNGGERVTDTDFAYHTLHINNVRKYVSHFGYDYNRQSVPYDIQVNPNGAKMTNAVLTDILPIGMSYDKEFGVAICAYGWDRKVFIPEEDVHFNPVTRALVINLRDLVDNGGRDMASSGLEIVGHSASNFNQPVGNYWPNPGNNGVWVIFSAKLDPEAYAEAFYNNSTISIYNEISLDFYEAGGLTNKSGCFVHIQNKAMDKGGQRVGNRVSYSLEINPHGLDIKQSGIDLELIDRLPEGMRLNYGSVRVYEAIADDFHYPDPRAQPSGSYQLTLKKVSDTPILSSAGHTSGLDWLVYDIVTNVFTVNLNDLPSMPYILEYECLITNFAANGGEFTNRATLSGSKLVSGATRSNTIWLNAGGAGTIVGSGTALQITKADDSGKPLAGVVFELKRSGVTIETQITDSNGKVFFCGDNGLPVDVEYTIAETFTPPGYHGFSAVYNSDGTYIGTVNPATKSFTWLPGAEDLGKTREFTVTNSANKLTVRKNFHPSGHHAGWGVNSETEFRGRVRITAGADSGKYMTLSGTAPNYVYTGVSATGSYFTFSAALNGSAVISGIPSNLTYTVEEEEPENLNGPPGVSASGSFENRTITVTNQYRPAAGRDLIIRKAFAANGNHTSWSVNSSTVFRARVKNNAGEYLIFNGTAPNYTYSGSSSPTGSFIEFSAGQQAIVKELTVGNYTIEEVIPTGAPYSSNQPYYSVAVSNSENATVTVTNVYDEGMGNLIISKTLSGSYDDWGVDSSTIFRARVRNRNTGMYLTLSGTAPNYTYTGESESGSYLNFTRGTATIISGIPTGAVCIVEEDPVANASISYIGNGQRIDLAGASINVTVVNTYRPGEGSLIINKQLAGSFADWSADSSTVFRARIRIVGGINNGKYLTFTGTAPNYTDTGEASETGSTIEFSAGRPARIDGIHIGNYVVEEIVPAGAPYTVGQSGYNVQIRDGQNSTVTVVNTYKRGNGELIISKALAGSYTDWGVDHAQVFRARVRIQSGGETVSPALTNGQYVTLSGTAPNYTFTGASPNGSEIIFTAGQSARIAALPTGVVYVVEEIIPAGANYSETYSVSSVQFDRHDQNFAVTVTNTYIAGMGALTVRKDLAGSPSDWGVNDDTVFRARVRDNVSGLFLTFSGEAPNYTYTGASVTGSLISFTKNRPAVLVGIPLRTVCEVIEDVQANPPFTVSYTDNGAVIANGQNKAVVVTNTYRRGQGDLIVNKQLAGSFTDWSVDRTTIFSARVQIIGGAGALNGEFLTLSGTAPNYTFTGSSPNGSHFVFTQGRAAVISGIPAGYVCIIVEDPPAGIKDISTSGSVTVTNGRNDTITVTNTFEAGAGILTVRKVLSGSFTDWGVDEKTVFQARIRVAEGADSGKYLTLSGTGPVYTFNDVGDTGDIINFSAGQPAAIEGVPTGIYVVEEVIPPGSKYTDSYIGNPASIVENGHSHTVTVTNTYEVGTRNLIINKALSGCFSDWGIDNSTEFTARVKDITPNSPRYGQYLTFDANHRRTGSNSTGSSVSFSVSQPVILTNMLIGGVYEIEEEGGANYTASYSDAAVTIPSNQNRTVTVTNTYGQGAGNLIVNKQLAGSFTDWGVDGATAFTARIKVTGGAGGDGTPAPVGSYLILDDDFPNFTFTGTNDTGSPLTFSQSRSAIISGIPAGWLCEVEEEAPIGIRTIAYSGNALISNNQNSTVTVINTFNSGVGSLIVSKQLAGSYGDWGVNDATVFRARVLDLDEGFVYFRVQPDGTYESFGNSGSDIPSGNTYELISFTKQTSAILTNLEPNRRYELIEIHDSQASYNTTYSYTDRGTVNDSFARFSATQNATATITNSYAHGVGNLMLRKALTGFPSEWGVNNSTEFKAEVYDNGTVADPLTPPKRLRFIPDGSGYRYVGNDEDGLYETLAPGVVWTNFIPITAAQPTTVSDLWPERIYSAVEVDAENCTTIYSGNYNGTYAIFANNSNAAITVTNRYQEEKPSVSLGITKRVQGSNAPANIPFTFTLTRLGSADPSDVTGVVGTQVYTYTGTASSPVNFNNIIFDNEGIYFYKVTEVNDARPNWTYSSNVYIVRVTVSREAGSDDLTAKVETVSGSDIFINRFSAGGGPTVPPSPPPTIPPITPQEPQIESTPTPGPTPTPDEPEDPSTPHIIFPEGTTPDDFPNIDFNATQPYPDTPGGTNPEAPPVPTTPGNRLMPVTEDDETYFIEFDDDDVPLGKWHWDDDEDEWMWFFDDDVPLGAFMPATGEVSIMHLLSAAGLLMMLAGVSLKFRKRRNRQ